MEHSNISDILIKLIEAELIKAGLLPAGMTLGEFSIQASHFQREQARAIVLGMGFSKIRDSFEIASVIFRCQRLTEEGYVELFIKARNQVLSLV